MLLTSNKHESSDRHERFLPNSVFVNNIRLAARATMSSWPPDNVPSNRSVFYGMARQESAAASPFSYKDKGLV